MNCLRRQAHPVSAGLKPHAHRDLLPHARGSGLEVNRQTNLEGVRVELRVEAKTGVVCLLRRGTDGRPGGLDQIPGASRYGRLFELPTVGAELPLAPGMSWAFEPSAVVGGRAVNLGGTVIIGEDDPIELNPYTAQLLRA